MKFFESFLFLGGIAYSTALWAQAPQVPHKMQFAGMTLTIRDDARREIQKDVDALTLSQKHFNIKAERAKTYFPIVEKIFDEEKVPVDFKFLVLQESSLVADAVSVSNAVGFWQFKDYTAIEMGLRVDKQIDERMNIVSSTRGAARYFKKNNTFFNNWLYALQAYQMGAGGVMQAVPDSESGATHMEITSKTYWYVKKFLAHKVAFESVNGPGQLQVVTIENKSKKSVADLAHELSVNETLLRNHNKWIKAEIIPEDRVYSVLIPVMGGINGVTPQFEIQPTDTKAIHTTSADVAPISISNAKASPKINGLQTIIAVKGETPASLAARAGVDLFDFLKWNDISSDDRIKVNQHYFLANKRNRSVEAFHKVLAGEDLWVISQNYGVKMKKLRRYNRMKTSDQIKPGETLWLSSKKPKDSEAINILPEVAQIDDKESFNWSTNPQMETSKTEKTDEKVVVNETIVEQEQKATAQPSDTLKISDGSSAQTIKTEAFVAKDSLISMPVRKAKHVVVAGETLYSIAHQNNVGVMELVNWNSLNLRDGIRPGQVLRLSEDKPSEINSDLPHESTEIVHEVKPSDTLFSIARKYGVTMKELMEWNEKKDFKISTGEKLKIIRK